MTLEQARRLLDAAEAVRAKTVRPIDLHRRGAHWVILPVCPYCKRQAPSCKCGQPNKRPL